ncbi:MAG: ParB/RepB/Spo0J family partition protein [Desulfatirhabdiaceae bacterium]
MVKYQKGKLYTLAVTDIMADPDQPRKYMDPDALVELAASIARHGVLEPLLFRVDEAGTPILVAGERRLEASRQAGLTTVPAMFVDGNHAEISLVENLLRENLTAVEEAEALDKIMKDHGYTQEALAGVIGKARSTVTEILTLNRLPQDIRDECRGNKTVSRSTLIEIARKKQARGMTTAWEKYKEKSQKQESGKTVRQQGAGGASALSQVIQKTRDKLTAYDSATWSEEEKNTLRESLTRLMQEVQSAIDRL